MAHPTLSIPVYVKEYISFSLTSSFYEARLSIVALVEVLGHRTHPYNISLFSSVYFIFGGGDRAQKLPCDIPEFPGSVLLCSCYVHSCILISLQD